MYHLIHDIAEDDFNIEKGGQVEIIGWLYQYYNTEPKNAAFAKNGKITKEEIPAVPALHAGLDRPAIWSKIALAASSSTSGRSKAFSLTVLPWRK